MKFTVVTSFNPAGYDQYGKRFIETYEKFWPKDIQLLAYGHDFKERPPGVIDLDNAMPRMAEFKKKFAGANGGPQYDFRKDAVKFCHKMFAIFHAAMTVKEGYLIWLDADTFTQKKITKKFLNSLVEKRPDIVHLGRDNVNYSETSFVAYNMKSPAALEFLADFQEMYLTGELFAYKEWHDGYVFERLLNLHKGHGLVAKNLTAGFKELNAFENSVLATYMTHLKGNLKEVNPNTSVLLPAAPIITNAPAATPVKIIPQNAVPDDVILRNVDANRKLIDRWIKKCAPHDRTAVIISGGPSIKKMLPQIKEMIEENPKTTVFCVKHSHNFLLENGIAPKFCTLLDPRPYVGLSTHNVPLDTLIAKPDKRIIYLAASMIDPDVTKHLISHNIRPLGWHAWTNSVAGVQLPEDQFFVTGGTCAAVRSIGLGHTMGFRKFECFGFDSCWPEQPNLSDKDERGRPRYFKASGSGPGGRQWWTTGELLSQAQDIENLVKDSDTMDLSLRFHGEGLVQDLVGMYNLKPKDDFSEWILTQ